MPDVTLTNLHHRHEIEGTLLHAPPTLRRYGSTMLRPDTIYIKYSFDATTWSAEQVTISGPRLRKDGTDGLDRSDNVYYLGGRIEDPMPEWLTTLVTQHTPEGTP